MSVSLGRNMIQGNDVEEIATKTSTIGHSHVLHPNWRKTDFAKYILSVYRFWQLIEASAYSYLSTSTYGSNSYTSGSLGSSYVNISTSSYGNNSST